jgi:pre-mRNA-processing factor SLU7
LLSESLTSHPVFTNNHTAVWGSWYDPSTGQWGYQCCHSIIHLSYCAGIVGKEAVEQSSAQHLLAGPPAQSQEQAAESSKSKEEQRHEKIEQNFGKKRIGEGDVKLDKDALNRALAEEKKRKLDDDDSRGGKRRKGAEHTGHEVTEEELGVQLLGTIYILSLTFASRGVPYEPTDDRRSNG